MTGSFHVLLSLAEAVMSFMPAVGTAAARRSRNILRRTSHFRIALVGTVMAVVGGIRTRGGRSDAVANGEITEEALSP